MVDALSRIEKALEMAVSRVEVPGKPRKLVDAIRHAVFPGGARIRPQLCVAVASACGEDNPKLTDAIAASIELMHCGSLVHDDMPCFDNADMRRGRPSVHCAFGEATALLAGDALIVLAYETIVRGSLTDQRRLLGLLTILSRAVGLPTGIIAGQGLECEARTDTSEYHRAKTGALFAGATMGGAIATGNDPELWRALGEKIGAAYQVADDILDVIGRPQDVGKPCGRDATLMRPSAVMDLGVAGAEQKLMRLLSDAVDSIPPCQGSADLQALVATQGKRLAPKRLAESAA